MWLDDYGTTNKEQAMTKKEATRQNNQEAALVRLGFTIYEAQDLRLLSKRLHTWNERLCNNTEVDESGKAFIYNEYSGKRYPCRNNGKGIERRLKAIQEKHPEVIIYEQGDPRGCAVYVVPKSELGARDVESYYSSVGIPVY